MGTVLWRFLDTGEGNAFFNMALDEAVVDAVRKKESPPTFRVFEWAEPAITVGYSQCIRDAIDFGRCEREGVAVTRRLTGGRAVFHDDDLGYSMIGSRGDPAFGGRIRDTFRSIHEMLVRALWGIGLDARLYDSASGDGSGDTVIAFSCWDRVYRFDILLDGGKLVGSAQRRFGDVFLQQGSIIIGTPQADIARYLTDPAAYRESGRLPGTGNFSPDMEYTGSVTINDLKKALFRELCEIPAIRCERGALAPGEIETAGRYVSQRYRSKGWVWKR